MLSDATPLQTRRKPRAEPRRSLQTLWVSGMLLLCACGREGSSPLFTLLPPEETGVTFVNAIREQEGFNVLEYEYFYNGAGVAAGDINNDGLPDLYFSANMVQDRLYLNMGGFAFRDITQQAGLTHESTWNTGVTMVDINDDGWLDLYVGRSGNVSADRRRNALYVNNGDLTFSEQAALYGLDDEGYTNHAAFLDYDRDGDLDAYLLNHSIRRFSNFLVEYMREQRDPLAGDKLMRNDAGFFTDVSESAGIVGNPLGFGLSVVVSDINTDGWPDLYVSNDYIEDDYLYINRQDGTFIESVREYLDHTSYSSMGADIADINHDGRPDLVTLDMLAEGNYRQKILKGPEDHIFYAKLRQDGFHEQYMRNMLHVSAGEDYMEVGQLAGISNTDWSWAALFADFDLDGYLDLLVTNGYLRDYTNLDFLTTILVEARQQVKTRGVVPSSLELVQHMSSTPVRNYLFQGGADLAFSNRTEAWGMEHPTFSNGAAYADLDVDGDLDVIISNINQPAHIYRNEARGSSLSIRLEGPPGNRQGIGAKVEVTAGDRTAHRELNTVRGYLSSVEPVLIFGTGQADHAAVTVMWSDGRRQHLSSVPADGTLTVKYDGSSSRVAAATPVQEWFSPAQGSGLSFRHRENAFVDFGREPLLPQLLSREGPALAVGDLNRDGLEDVFVGGARGQPSVLFLQQIQGTFVPVDVAVLSTHRYFEDVGALLFDADGDLDLDLYVVSGGSSEPEGDSLYQDRLYVNVGFGRLEYRSRALPDMRTSTSVVAAHDFDGDGDQDLFVGGRVRPGYYPMPPRSYLLANTPDGFVDVTATVSPELVRPGMVSDAVWADITGDGRSELVMTGEWMPLRVFECRAPDRLEEITATLGLEQTEGFWNALAAEDLDRDGDLDIVAGNRGLNTQVKVSPESPASVYAADFDRNGTLDALMSAYIDGQEALIHWRDAVISQLPSFAQRFPTHESYASATMEDLLTDTEREAATRLVARFAASSVFENVSGRVLRRRDLPQQAQVAPVQDLLIMDVNGDSNKDLIVVGNQYGMRAAVGRQNAGRGLVMLGDGAMGFEGAGSRGLSATQDARELRATITPDHTLILIASNDGDLEIYRWRR